MRADTDTGRTTTIELDDAGNILEFDQAPTTQLPPNSAPSCSNVTDDVQNAFAVVDGIQSCSDPDGDSLIVTHVDDPSGPATSSSSNDIYIAFGNVTYDFTVSVTVSDQRGGYADYQLQIIYTGGGGGF